MRRTRFILTLPLLLALSVIVSGCPQQVDSMVRELVPPDDYKPVYLTSSVNYTDLLRQYGSVRIEPGEAAPDTAIASAAAGAAPLRFEIRTVDDSRYPDRVELRAFVYDTTGRFVMGLAPPRFAGTGTYRDYWRTLVDSCNGSAVPITDFDVTEVREDRREPYSIAFVLDHSGSMDRRRVRILREAVARTLRIIKRGDMVSVITFTEGTVNELPLTDDPKKIRTGFNPADLSTFGGGTALYDAAVEAIDEVSRAPATHHRTIILFTDGADGDSQASLEDVYRHARENHVTIYTIAYGMAVEEPMRDLARYTGGRMYRIYQTREYPYVFTDIYRRMNNYYRITYRAPECAGLHTATSSLSIPDLGLRQLLASGEYDQSLFTPFDTVGSIALVNIEFDFDKATIRPESMPKVQQVAEVMNAYPSMTMEIRGHTDDRGTEQYNQQLSEQRARAVADALVELGIARRRLTVKGLGESDPLVPNDSEANRERNRRTEFVITGR